MKKNVTLAFMACLALSVAPAFASDMEMDHSTMHHETSGNDAFAASRDAMHKDMDVKPSGNIDKDFVRNMIPHHEGAVAMAKVELEKGKDPMLRKLAQDIIDAQEKEIAFMKDWLQKH